MPKRGETVVRPEEEEEEEEEKVEEVAGGSEGGAREKDKNKEKDTSDTDTRPRNTRGRADGESGRVTGESRERGSRGGRRARFGEGQLGSRSSQRRQAGEGCRRRIDFMRAITARNFRVGSSSAPIHRA